MMPRAFLKLTTLSFCAFGLVACADGSDVDEDTPRSALLFDLSEDEVSQIHAAYLPDEDIALTIDRLTAPFECSLYDQFCDQVGRDAAYEITGELVDLALDGAPIEDIDAHFDARVEEAIALADLAEDQGQETFRASGSWTTQTSGNYRMRVRNGVSTPVIGSRKAWTEANTQRQGALGTWGNKEATQICVNTGTNTQTHFIHTSSTGTTSSVIESFNPSNSCSSGVASKTSTTYHSRNSGGEGDGIQWWYTIHANGCATAEINGINFSRCAGQFGMTY